ncbi:MAG: antitoxin family protein [Candidatus Competibacter denitrificans]|jgi:predicted DNA-binding antitoxin AbrB/MazE fold protein
MSKNLKAVYENGIFRPLEPVDLTEHQEVTITVPDPRGAVANHELSCYEIAQRLGIVGMLDHLPSDVSTNRRYFEGFGQE